MALPAAAPLLRRSAAVVGVGFASAYGVSLWTVLRGLHGAAGPEAGRFCGTPGVFALTFGALVCAPLALGLGAAIVRARAGLPAGDSWRILAAVALVALLVVVAVNWFAFVPYLLL